MNTSPFSTTFRATSRLASITILVALALSGCGGNSATSPPGGEPSADMAPSFPAMSGAAQTWTDEGAVHLTIPAASGGDGALSYAATGLPAGVSFDPVSRALSGTPEAAGSGTITITVTDTDADGRHDTDTYTIAWMVRPSLIVGSGLHQSEAEPAYADAGGETLANHLDDGTTFAPLTSTLTRTWGDAPSTSVSSTGWHVREIQGDGQDGFRVTYVSDNGRQERMIHFSASDMLEDEPGTFEVTDGEGNQFWFSVWNQGYRYFDTGTSGGLGERFWFVFGVRTPQSGLPAGSATYRGRLRADAWSAGNPEHSQRQRIYGDMRIVSNFDLGTLMGEVDGIQGTEPGAPGSSRSAWSTSSFTITDGRMVDGQFTATITGHDSDASASLAQSVAGYAGRLLGEFYGPGANEIGAVLTATRDLTGSAHDRVIQGYVGGTKKSFMDLEPFSTGVDRHDYSTTSPRIVSQNADNRVTAVTFDGDSEYRIAYLVDGEPRSVTLDDSHLGGLMSEPDAYWRREGSVGHYFNPLDVNEYVSRGFWAHGRYPDDDADSDLEFGTAGYVVYGQRTAPGSMPGSGTATYSGDVSALAWSPSPASASTRHTPSYRGMLHLTADFAADSVAGRIDSLRRQETDDDSYMPMPGQFFEIGNGMIQSNGFSGDLSGLGYSGTVEGGFFGPAASEVGGVLEATGNGEMLHGSFTGRRQ